MNSEVKDHWWVVWMFVVGLVVVEAGPAVYHKLHDRTACQKWAGETCDE